MSEQNIRFAEYGQTGDSVSARRARHAFRYCVLAVLMFTVGLWFADNYLRYAKAERLYRMALTKERDSARALLRNLVPQGGEMPQDSRLARYLAALAFIEDSTDEREHLGMRQEYAVDPLVIERYEQAYQADKRSEFILLSYGCALFLDAQYTKARDRFRDARTITEQPNALAAYLEAAARAQVGELGEALSLITQTNANEDMRVRIPRPLWHADLPQEGRWYAKMRAEVTERFLAPLVTLKGLVLGHIREAHRADPEETGEAEMAAIDASAWLDAFAGLGQRLVGEPSVERAHPVGFVRARTGINFEYDALRERERRRPDDRAVAARIATLNRASKELDAFLAERKARIAAHEAIVARPLHLAGRALLVLLMAYLVAYVLAKYTHAGRISWSLPHPRWGQAIVVVLLGLMLALLFYFTLLQRITLAPSTWLAIGTYGWYVVLAAMGAFGLVYPALFLPLPGRVAGAYMGQERAEEAVHYQARRAFRTAYISMLRRYFGVILGGYVIMGCVWVLGFRVFVGLYPILQRKLLVTGLQGEEFEIVRQVQQMLL
ncbi:MAG: hypothetical protein ACLFTT_01060 [Candidatus Hydrogenedentota bacterium]